MTDLVYGWSIPVYRIFADVREERYRQLKRGPRNPDYFPLPGLTRQELVFMAATVFAWIEELDAKEEAG